VVVLSKPDAIRSPDVARKEILLERELSFWVAGSKDRIGGEMRRRPPPRFNLVRVNGSLAFSIDCRKASKKLRFLFIFIITLSISTFFVFIQFSILHNTILEAVEHIKHNEEMNCIPKVN